MLYKTVWEISQKVLINMAADRGPFIDQSQSLNMFISDPNLALMSSVHFYGWKKGLKTGMYYLRTKPAVDPIKFTVDFSKVDNEQLLETKNIQRKSKIKKKFICNQKDDSCLMCGS